MNPKDLADWLFANLDELIDWKYEEGDDEPCAAESFGRNNS